MTSLDLTRPHIVTAPHKIPFTGTWVAFCTCGEEFMGADAEAVREARRPHWDAEQKRLSGVKAQWAKADGSPTGNARRSSSPRTAGAPNAGSS